jgi:hypothetical protein
MGKIIMNKLTIANNQVFSYIMGEDELISALKVEGYNVFDKLYNVFKDKEFNSFRTPINLDNPTSGPGYQYEPVDLELISKYKTYICNVVNTELASDFEVKDMWYLHQTDDSWVDNPIHKHLTAEWVAVLYLDVNPGDGIEFYDEAGNNVETYNPVFGEILFHSGEALHKPAPNISSKRLTINVELGRVTRPDEELETIKSRFAICSSCNSYDTETGMCSEKVEYYSPMKVTIMKEVCPVGKW